MLPVIIISITNVIFQYGSMSAATLECIIYVLHFSLIYYCNIIADISQKSKHVAQTYEIYSKSILPLRISLSLGILFIVENRYSVFRKDLEEYPHKRHDLTAVQSLNGFFRFEDPEKIPKGLGNLQEIRQLDLHTPSYKIPKCFFLMRSASIS